MTITTAATLRKAMAAGRGRQDVSFAMSSGYRAWREQSLWLDAGGAQPSTMAACDNTTTGALPLPTAGGGSSLHLAEMSLASGSYSGQTVLPYDQFVLVDRLAACGNLAGNVTDSQSIGTVTLSRGLESDLSNLAWFVEWYGTSGGTSVTWTWTYTDSLDNTGQTFTTTNSTSTASRAIQWLRNPAGKIIKAITAVQLSATTGVSNSFGVTACRLLGGSVTRDAFRSCADWQQLALMSLDSASCVQLLHLGQYFGTGTGGKILIAKG